MARKTAAQVAEKWNRRLKGSTQDIEAGVQAVSESPTAKAARKADKMRAKVVESIDSGKWASGLNRVTLEDWKNKTTRKGIPRIAQGADEAVPKMQAFMGELLPHIEAVKAEVAGMPDMTLEDSLNRMNTFIRGMSRFRRGSRS